MIGKSWLLALLACIRAILYPNSNILVCAKLKKQAKLLLTSKIMGDLYKRSPALRREIKYLKNDNNECKIVFHNGSVIEAVVSTDEARGFRANFLIIDEYRMLSQEMVDSVLIPFLNTPRQPAYLSNPKYYKLIEENVEVYISSGWNANEWSYNRWEETINGMLEGDDMFACSLAFTTAITHGLTTKKRIQKEMKKESMTATTFKQEYCGLWTKEDDSAFFKSKDIDPCRTLTDVFYPPSNDEYNKYRNKTKKPWRIPKVKGEIRIISCDIAISKGAKKQSKDNSIFDCIRLIPNGGEYERHLVCMESYLGKEAEEQAIRIKELYEDFEADYIVIDTEGIGYSVATYLHKKSYDRNRMKEYAGYVPFNDDNKVDEEIKKKGIPVVYSMSSSYNLNMIMANSLRDCLYTQKIKLPVSELQAKDLIFKEKNIGYEEIQKKIEVEGKLLVPFAQTDIMVSEMTGLETKWKDAKNFSLKEKGQAKKDRYSALLYGNHLCDYLEEQNYKLLNRNKRRYMFLT